MLKDRRRMVERFASARRLRLQLIILYGAFLRTLFSTGDWFVTFTFRDRHQDSPSATGKAVKLRSRRSGGHRVTVYAPDPRIESREPVSKNRPEPGPPVRDAALREIEHYLVELGWEAAGHSRQELFDFLADGLYGRERRNFARSLCRRCLCCALLNDPTTFYRYGKIYKIATAAIGWVIAEEFGRAGGRWHVHLLVSGVQHLHRKKWWKRAFVRFGRSRIEPIHE